MRLIVKPLIFKKIGTVKTWFLFFAGTKLNIIFRDVSKIRNQFSYKMLPCRTAQNTETGIDFYRAMKVASFKAGNCGV